MKSSLLTLLAAATLSFASMGAIHAQETTTPDAAQSEECGATAGNMGAPASLESDSTDDDAANAEASQGDMTDGSTADSSGTCCIGKDGAPTVQGVDADCPAKDESTDN